MSQPHHFGQGKWELTEEYVQQEAEAEIEETLHCDYLCKDQPGIPHICPIKHIVWTPLSLV